MSQTILTVAFDVQPAGAAPLEGTVTKFRQTVEGGCHAYDQLGQAVPTLHFMSLMVFTDVQFDPLFLLEVNFDGPRDAFWPSLVQAIGPDLRTMLGFCAPPRDRAQGKAFDHFVETGEGLAAVLDAAAITPTASHLGNRGLSRARIEAEGELFAAVQKELGDDRAYRGLAPPAIHAKLRVALLPANDWLSRPGPSRVTVDESVADYRNLAVFACAAVTVLTLPGVLLAALVPAGLAAVLVLVAAMLIWWRIPDLHPSQPAVPKQVARPPRNRLLPARVFGRTAVGLIILVIAVIACVHVLSLALWLLNDIAAVTAGQPPPDLRAWLGRTFGMSLVGLLGLPAVLLGLVYSVRRLEGLDGANCAARPDPTVMRQMQEREDQTSEVFQNHMGSIALVKAGGLRTLLLVLIHTVLHLYLRVNARDGYLSDMRTIHFAHWALLGNRGRLLFMSNFDGTWDSYLDDFIEKAHAGTTLAWTNCIGSPLARFLLLDGVTHGRQFKAWARRSMTPNLFWFSAYPKLTVNQIERNHLVAEGLRCPTLDPTAATEWTRIL